MASSLGGQGKFHFLQGRSQGSVACRGLRNLRGHLLPGEYVARQRGAVAVEKDHHDARPIDIETFRPLTGFTHDADALTAILKALPRQAGFDEITLPGERSQRTEAKRRKSGIPIPAKLWEELEGIGKKFSVKLPETLSATA